MDLSVQECTPLPSVKLTPTVAEFSPNTGQESPVTATSGSSQDPNFGQAELPLTFCAEDSLAKTLAPPERRSASKASASKARDHGYGENMPVLLARYDLNTQSWRTSQLCLEGDLAMYLETFPRSGMTQNGTAYRLPPLVRLTKETASGLWPTPTSADCRGTTGGNMRSSLRTEVKMFPTPTTMDAKDRGCLKHGCIQKRLAEGKQLGLSQVASPISGTLNPTWVEWLMGYPIGWTELKP